MISGSQTGLGWSKPTLHCFKSYTLPSKKLVTKAVSELILIQSGNEVCFQVTPKPYDLLVEIIIVYNDKSEDEAAKILSEADEVFKDILEG